jgi:LysM repeat protein
MKSIYSIFLVLLWYGAFAQPKNNFIKHTVEKGETITEIARKYKVTPFDIYQLNPEAKTSLQVNSVLKIPVELDTTISADYSKNDFFEYEVKSQETLYGISKKFGVSIASIEKSNPEIFSLRGLNPGDRIKIPNSNDKHQVASFKIVNDTLFHIVKQKETPFGVAKQYGITVQKLYELNPEAEKNFNIDDKIIIKINQNAPTVVKPNSEIQVKENKIYIVQPKETLYRLSLKFGCTENDILALNPSLKNGLKAGDTIITPAINQFLFERKNSVDLTKTIDIYKPKKDLVLMVPFNVKKIEADSTIKIQERFKKDLFLNMSLDFYSGALMAIDSAKSLGINMKVRIFDSEETNNTSNVLNILQENDFSNVGAIIGPFYPQHINQTAQLVSNQNIPVFSPLRELNGTNSNAYQTLVKGAFLRECMFQYLSKKEGNILAALDNQNSESYYYLSQKPKVRILPLNEKGNVVLDSLSKHLKANQTNYVILDAKKTGFILNIINSLSNLNSKFDIKLVTLEKNDAFEFEEINIKKLAKLNLIYPSQIQDANFDRLNLFSIVYKQKYNTLPNQFAIRGFDITLDLILRLAQKQPFLDNIKNVVSEQISSKFDYTNNIDNTVNQGAYIQQYQDDLTIKTMND